MAALAVQPLSGLSNFHHVLELTAPIGHAVRDESEPVENRNALRSKSRGPRIRAAVRLESHHGI